MHGGGDQILPMSEEAAAAAAVVVVVAMLPGRQGKDLKSGQRERLVLQAEEKTTSQVAGGSGAMRRTRTAALGAPQGSLRPRSPAEGR